MGDACNAGISMRILTMCLRAHITSHTANKRMMEGVAKLYLFYQRNILPFVSQKFSTGSGMEQWLFDRPGGVLSGRLW